MSAEPMAAPPCTTASGRDAGCGPRPAIDVVQDWKLVLENATKVRT